MRDDIKKYKTFSRRAFVLCSLKIALICIIGSRFYKLQILEREKYLKLSDKNRIKIKILPPLRGNILDRNNVKLATNKLFYNVLLDKEGCNHSILEAEKIISKLESILGYKTYISHYGIEKAFQTSKKSSINIIIQENISWLDIAKIELSTDIYGIEISRSYKRQYEFSKLLCHVIGYISRPSKSELETGIIPNYEDLQIGKNGIEKEFNETLQGTPGINKTEVNAFGRRISDLSMEPSIIGNNIKLTIDSQIQNIVAKTFSDFNGALVIMDPFTAEVLSLYSSPTYDTNRLVSTIVDNQYWQDLLMNPNKPLINKSISSLYPPGSTFKLVTALAILSSNVDAKEKILCTGEHKFGNRIFHCWNKYGHGYVNMVEAIAKSCNIYFYIQSLKAKITEISRIAKILGLGTKTGIELPYEVNGIIPDKNWKMKRFKGVWQYGDTINTSIGQGYTLVSIIQLANMISRIVSGKNTIPKIKIKNNINTNCDSDTDNSDSDSNFYSHFNLDSAFNSQTTNKLNNYHCKDRNEYTKNSSNSCSVSDSACNSDCIAIDQSNLNIIKKGMYNVFNDKNGIGYLKRPTNFLLAGKTGTAQIISKEIALTDTISKKNKDHSLFAGFAPYDNPKYAIAIIVENGGWGSQTALPIAKAILSQLLL